MAQGIRSAAALAAWMHVLDDVQESIARAVAEVDEHERMLAAAEAPAAAPGEIALRGLEQFEERLGHLRHHLAAADDVAAQVAELLVEDESAARAWLDGAAAAARRLATAGAAGLS